MTLRELGDRYNAFIVRHEVAWELVMAALAVVFVVVGFAGDDASPDVAPAFDAADVGLTIIFAAEFAPGGSSRRVRESRTFEATGSTSSP